MKKCGVSVDKESLDAFFKAMDGQTVTDAIAAGSKKCISMPSGGGGGGKAAAGPAAAAAPEKEVEEKKEEPEDVDMGGLFGDDDDY